jgi:hypothetical protein
MASVHLRGGTGTVLDVLQSQSAVFSAQDALVHARLAYAQALLGLIKALGVAKSLTQPQRGDEVVLQLTGRDTVTVQRQGKNAQGTLQPKAAEAYRNPWVIEKREFFEQRTAAAQIVRNETIEPRVAVREHPELAGTYLNLRARDRLAGPPRSAGSAAFCRAGPQGPCG